MRYEFFSRNIVFDDSIIVLGSVQSWEWIDTTDTIIFTKKRLTNSSNAFSWHRTSIHRGYTELYPTTTVGINSKYVAVGLPVSEKQGNGTIFLYSRQNLTAPPLRINPRRPYSGFGSQFQLSGNTLAATYLPTKLQQKTVVYIYKYNRTSDSWNVNSPVLLALGTNAANPNFSNPIKLSGTTVIQDLGQVYNSPVKLNKYRVAVFDEDAARTGKFTLTQNIDVPSIGTGSFVLSRIGGRNIAIYTTQYNGQQYITMYRRQVRKGKWYQVQRVKILNGLVLDI